MTKPDCTILDDEGFGFRAFIIKKNKRYKGQDGIELQYRFPDNSKIWRCMTLKDWEAIAIINILTTILLKKKKVLK